MSYLVATQSDLGEAVFRTVALDGEAWTLRHARAADPDFGVRLADLCAQVQPRYVFFVDWTTPVDPEILARWECVGLHPAPLPHGRGPDPIENLLLSGRRHTVLTAYRMTRDLYAGPIYDSVGPLLLEGSRAHLTGGLLLAPAAILIRAILAHTPEPVAQSGQVVMFSPLSPLAKHVFWRARGEQEEAR